MPHASTISLTVIFSTGAVFMHCFIASASRYFMQSVFFPYALLSHKYSIGIAPSFTTNLFPLSSLLLDRFCLFLSSSFCQKSLNLLYTDCLKNTRKKPARCMIWYRFFLLFYSFLFLDGRLLMIFPISRMSARNLILLSHRDQTVDILARKFPGTSK